MIMQELWLPVVGWEDCYDVSNHGRVRSIDRVIEYWHRHGTVATQRRIGVERKLSAHKSGHIQVSLRAPGGRHRTYQVHRLVLEAFVGPCPPGLEGCHENGIHSDNHIDNLRWGTRGSNVLDSVRHGTNVNANKTHCKRNHPLSGDNMRIEASGSRRCRTCAAMAMERWKARQT